MYLYTYFTTVGDKSSEYGRININYVQLYVLINNKISLGVLLVKILYRTAGYFSA